MNILTEQAARIISLEIQGATEIALFSIRCLNEFAQRHKDEPKAKLWRLIRDAEQVLVQTRSTEPTMRNALAYILGNVLEEKKRKVSPLNIAESIDKYTKLCENEIKDAKEKIAAIGAKRIPKDPRERFTVMTHCHSSIVEAILIEAHKQGRKFDVICTETRPKFQGRITAKVLSNAGIKVQMVVDSAMRWACKNEGVDIIFIGADAVTSEGTVMNKIGSRLLALVAEEENIPFYVATPLFKYNLGTLTGELEKIERRNVDELWSAQECKHIGIRPDAVGILDPAFETVARKYIAGVITEIGLFPADHTHFMFEKKYPFLVNSFHCKPDEFEGWDY